MMSLIGLGMGLIDDSEMIFDINVFLGCHMEINPYEIWISRAFHSMG